MIQIYSKNMGTASRSLFGLHINKIESHRKAILCSSDQCRHKIICEVEGNSVYIKCKRCPSMYKLTYNESTRTFDMKKVE